MEHWIASLDLIAVRGSSRSPLLLRVAAPVAHPDGHWTCRVDLAGLHDALAPAAGEDALQALCLSLGLAAILLRDFQSNGGRLEYPTGEEFPLEAYFSTFGTSATAS